ncbi:GreA/GreB family elongation factor [Paenibacillus thermoaerophilus]|uniref:GreA/GreB family elongation factor n=1 Tax=Paenibacillus thermoaerophilus TaxID=1215385 RepID=A0ABW2V3E3_9BACL|nr:GreA/GreB family elongation factor [Paenibacillus thermoaerophilus]
MSPSLPASGFRERLVRQIVALSEERSQFLDTYFPMPGRERKALDQLLSDYIGAVEKLLQLPDESIPPVVLIGSDVRIAYLNEDSLPASAEWVTIIHPDQAEADENRISFLSPVGKQLLLKSEGEVLTIRTPSGELKVRVESVRHHQDLSSAIESGQAES